MTNILENGLEWNLYENLKEFKDGRQSIFKTKSNIIKLIAELKLVKKERRELEFMANQEREFIKLSNES